MQSQGTPGNGAERREYIRVPLQMLVRSYDSEVFHACEGDLSLGGARIRFAEHPTDPQVEVLVDAGGPFGQVRLQGDIIDLRHEGDAWEARVQFVESPVTDELGLARLLHRLTEEWEPWSPSTALN
ncbi:MAG: PilZ domain-containing protein [Deltaproteobacteria bacterium]|nr:PilZ domain-containing protein [Deltaproteobacteria bacterium]